MRSVSIADLDEVAWAETFILLGVHGPCLVAFWTGVSWKAVALCAALYAIRMFAISGGYHRYYAHRSYRTSRVFQFVLAAIGCSAMQKGPLWWAAYHRHHHQHADQQGDVHSPGREGFWWSHIGWITSTKYSATRFDMIQDFARYPELRLLDRFNLVPAALVAVGCYLAIGWQGLVWGFFISTALLYHATFAINSLSHMFGTVRYKTTDTSRNSFVLSLITLGEGWHNNHHYYATSSRLGFLWWEIDFTFYTLKLLSVFGLIWDMKPPPSIVGAARTTAARA